LLKHFGSLKRLASATVDEISEVPGVGRHTASVVHTVLSAGKTTDSKENEHVGGGSE
jgi:excinuclease ABC subunit C